MEYAPHVQRHWFCRIRGLLIHGCDPITALRFYLMVMFIFLCRPSRVRWV